jgi:predicted DNA binding CopG/RHH family protein
MFTFLISLCTDKAVVTLPGENSIQFINTTNNTKYNKINIGVECRGVTAVKDKIYIGGLRYFIFIGFVILVYIYLWIR